MSNDINAAGYELKPWWPYVRELMSNQVTVESVTILENGVYTAPAGKAYSPVTVNVPTYDVDALSVTENGTYTPETGNAYNSVIVNVPSDFSTATVSITNNSSAELAIYAAIVLAEENTSGSSATLSPSESVTITAALYKGGCGYSIQGEIQTVSIQLTGDIEASPFGNAFGTIQGNGTITITDSN